LAIWKRAAENQYRLLQVMETDDLLDEKFLTPTLITPKGRALGEEVQFLYIAKSEWRGAEDILFAVDPFEGELRPVEIESAEKMVQQYLRPSEGISVYSRNDFADHTEPGFEIFVTKPNDANCCPSAGLVTGTYKIVKESLPSGNPDQPFVNTWKFVPARAKRKPLPR
jgi:hypothetical protein